MKKQINFIFFSLFLFPFFQVPSLADEYLTDSPEILKPGYAWVSLNSSLTKRKNKSIQAPLFESKLWLMEDFQARFTMPVILSIVHGKTTTYGYGDVDVGLKYRFIHETDFIPQVAFFPKFLLPSGDASRRLGNAKAIERVPLWAQKELGKWKISGGGGYAFNQAPHQFNFLYGGFLIRRSVSDSLTLGAELFAEGPHSLTEHSTLICNFAGRYDFTPESFFVCSAAHSVAGAKFLRVFLGVGLTWGP